MWDSLCSRHLTKSDSAPLAVLLWPPRPSCSQEFCRGNGGLCSDKNIASGVPSIDPGTVVNAGATDLVNHVPVELYHSVIVAYNRVVTHPHCVGVAMACCSVLGAVLLEWVHIKGEK